MALTDYFKRNQQSNINAIRGNSRMGGSYGLDYSNEDKILNKYSTTKSLVPYATSKPKSTTDKNGQDMSDPAYFQDAAPDNYYTKPKSSSKSASKSKKSGMSDEEKARRAQEKQLEEIEKQMRKAAKGKYNTGLSQLENLLKVLDDQYSQGVSRKGQEFTTAKDEFEEEKNADYNKLRAFYASVGTGDSEQAGQGRERLFSDYAKRFGALEQENLNDLQDLASQKDSAKMTYENQRMSLKDALEGDYASAEEKIVQLMNQFQQQDLQERKFKLDEMRTNYAINKPYSNSSAQKTGKYTAQFNPTTGKNEFLYVDPVGNQSIVDESSYLQGKYGVGIGNFQGVDPLRQGGMEEMSDEELQNLLYGTDSYAPSTGYGSQY